MLLLQQLLALFGLGLGYMLLLASPKAVIVKIYEPFCLAYDQLLIKRYCLGEIDFVEVLLARSMNFLSRGQKSEGLFQLFDWYSH